MVLGYEMLMPFIVGWIAVKNRLTLCGVREG